MVLPFQLSLNYVTSFFVAPNITFHLEIVKTFNIPTIKYPKISKKIKKMPKPEDLQVRWKPFGSGIMV